MAKDKKKSMPADGGVDKESKAQGRLHWWVENLESILSAILFALIIRAFIIEAFQIPTGSMATAFLGIHADIQCANCNFKYAVGSDSNGPVPRFPGRSVCPLCQYENSTRVAKCPNCGKRYFPAVDPKNRNNYDADSLVCPKCKYAKPEFRGAKPVYGDKILVCKNFNLFKPLERYQLVVFKAPFELGKNFIKRAVALGGERLQVSRGDIFINGRIQPKPLKAQLKIWQPVYRSANSDRRIDSGQGWKLEKGWRNSNEMITYSGGGPSRIRLREPIYDDHGYNLPSRRGQNSLLHIVGDLRIEAVISGLTPLLGEKEGYVELSLEEDNVRYGLRLVYDGAGAPQVNRLCLTRGKLNPANSEKHEILEEINPGGPANGRTIALANLDNYLYVWLDGRMIKKHWIDEGAELEGMPKEIISSDALLSSSGGKANFSNIKIDRDLYYYLPKRPIDNFGNTIVTNEPSSDVPEYKNKIIFDARTESFIVPRDSFIVMGDNCHISKDSRIFGPVPTKYLLGKPFCIWFPLSRIKLVR